MNIEIFSQDRYFSFALNYLIKNEESYAKHYSIVFIDVMDLPELSMDDMQRINNANDLVFVVHGSHDHLLIDDNIPLKLKDNINVKYICKSSPYSEFKKIVKERVTPSRVMGGCNNKLNKTELKLVNSIKHGISIKLNPIYKSTNMKILSAQKRNVMRKLNITTEITLYKVVIKCFYLKTSILENIT